MEFNLKEGKEIKGELNAIQGYADILKNEYKGEVENILNEKIDIFNFSTANSERFILGLHQQQIGDCKAIVDHRNKEYFMSSVAILSNLQRRGIGNGFFKKVFIPQLKEKYPDYSFVKAPKQTEIGAKYVISREREQEENN